MLNFVICDDNTSVLGKLRQMLDKIFAIQNISANVVFQSTNPYEVLDFVSNNQVNVLVLDIDLKSSISGLELASKIRENNKSLYIIFITAHPEYVFLAYQSKTFDFLLKPITIERLSETIERLTQDISESPKKFINIDKHNKVFVDTNDVTYIKKDAMKLVFHTFNRQYETYNSFSKIESLLPGNFVRCHKSYIVNIKNIANISSNNIIKFRNNDVCDIGPKYKNNLMEVIKNYGNISDNLDCINN